MTGWPDKPVIYEVNTAVWLDQLARTAQTAVTLGTVSEAAWAAWAWRFPFLF